MFNNHGDRQMNRRILQKLGYNDYYESISKDFFKSRHYVVINLSANIELQALRVCTNLFGKYIQFY